jgi:hypothetical protein
MKTAKEKMSNEKKSKKNVDHVNLPRIIEAPPILEALPLLEAPSRMVDVRNVLEASLILKKFLKFLETFISIFIVKTVKTRGFWVQKNLELLLISMKTSKFS